MATTYKDIAGFPGYRVGDDGSVWSCWKAGWQHQRSLGDTWKPLKLSPSSKGYLRVNLTPLEGGRYKTFSVHRLVLTAFRGECPDGMESRHLNGIRADNRLDNLAWGTRDDNYADIRLHDGYGNRKRNRRYTHDGKTMSLKQWADHLEVPYGTLYQRVTKAGMPFSDAISFRFCGVAGNGKPLTRLG